MIPLRVDPSVITQGVNYVWILAASFLIFFTQPDFALLKAGQVRAKNVGNVLMKNMIDWVLGVFVYLLIGAEVMTIVGGLTSPGGFGVAVMFSYIGDSGVWVDWLFGAVFAMTATTIVPGAVTERMNSRMHIVFAATVTGSAYPIVRGLTWSGDLPSSGGYIGAVLGVGYLDFIGVTIVYMCGGIVGLVGAKITGPHRGRFDSSGNGQSIPGHSMLPAVLSTLILAFGWYGSNAGTQATVLMATDSGGLKFMDATFGCIALVTTLGIGIGVAAAVIVSTNYQSKPDPLWITSDLLAGPVVAIGAVPHVTWWGGLILGALGGAVVLLAYRWTVGSLRIDDVCGIFAVHDVVGAVGTVFIPVFAMSGFSGTQLVMQVAGVVVIVAWIIVAPAVVFAIAGVIFDLRALEEEEEEGLDTGEHGVSVYPEFIGDIGPDGVLGSPTATDGGSDIRTGDGAEQDETVEANGGSNQ